MQKNKIVLVLALGMMLSPLFVINGEETTTTTANTNVKIGKGFSHLTRITQKSILNNR